MSRAISTLSFNLQQAPPIFSSLESRSPTCKPSLSSFWINDKENLASSSSNLPTSSTLASNAEKKRAAYISCETKLKRMMMEDENYSFILNPCCDKIDCKFVKNAILKDSRTRNLSRDSLVASLISIDSEDGVEFNNKVADSLLASPLRTNSVEKVIRVDPLDLNDDDTQLIYKNLFDELISSTSLNHIQTHFDEKLAKLKSIIRERKNRKMKT